MVKHKDKPLPWEIIGAEYDGPKGVWVYKLDFRKLKQQEVNGDDGDWSVVERKLSREEAEVAQFLDGRISRVNPKGSVSMWLQKEEQIAAAISDCGRMNETLQSDKTVKYLWSGGAADCICVASADDGMAKLIHITRLTCDDALAAMVSTHAPFYLSSKYFAEGPVVAAESGTVQGVIQTLKKYKIGGIFTTGFLAINARTGEVLADFPAPKETVENPKDEKK